ncbi:MAG TPA: oxidoreductase [Gemmatimonadaceae bacterium]|jgi:NAD(P)-dependent dehydrogenase (short-subunit alcohol dehydrogenase family)|nr:oxidoreductase [Gemmatimonadaceae bacterium]
METSQHPINSGFGERTTAREIAATADLTGKRVVITGGYAGLGLETTRVLADRGAEIIAGARDVEKATKNLAGIPRVTVRPLDLADRASIDRFADDVLASVDAIDLLINNAGIMATPLMRDARGYEMQFATNHLGHFQLTNRLLPALERRGACVVSLTSAGHRFSGVDFDDPNFLNRPYDKWKAYGQSKSANSLFAVELDARVKDRGVRAFAVHPGRILDTELVRYISIEDLIAAGIRRPDGSLDQSSTKTVEQGAATTVWCATTAQLDGLGGVYCADCDISPIVPDDSKSLTGVRSWAIDKAMAERLWELSGQLVEG